MKYVVRHSRLVVALAATALLMVSSMGTAQAASRGYGGEHSDTHYAPGPAASATGTASGGTDFHYIGYGPIKNHYGETAPGNSTRCLDAQNLTPPNTPNYDYDYVQIWSCNGKVNQNWTFSYKGNGWYAILNEYGNHLALTAENDQYDNPGSNGDAVWMWHYFGGCEQLWQPVTVEGEPGSSDYLAKIVNKCYGKVLDAELHPPIAYPSQNGDYVQLWDYHDGTNQMWHG